MTPKQWATVFRAVADGMTFYGGRITERTADQIIGDLQRGLRAGASALEKMDAEK